MAGTNMPKPLASLGKPAIWKGPNRYKLQKVMHRFIFSLPRELCFMIMDLLSEQDKFRLSATSKQYRRHLAPHLFRTIRFGNDLKTSPSAYAAARVHGDIVRRLEFVYCAEPIPHCHSPALLSTTRRLLEGDATPDAVAFDFRFEFKVSPEYNSYGYNRSNTLRDLVQAVEHPVETMEAEKRYRWRAVLSETYQAIAENTSIQEIVLDSLLPISVSAFYSSRFGDWLGRLRSATIRICSPDSFGSPGRVARTDAGYRDFVSRLPDIFFSRMKCLEHLDLVAPLGFPLGGKEPRRARKFPLAPDNMPRLHSLSLNHVFVCPELIRWMQSHAFTLSSVHLVDCISDTGGRYDKMATWGLLFSRMLDLRPLNLVRFSVEYNHSPLLELMPLEQCEDPEAKEIDLGRAKDPKRKIFAYGALESKGIMVTSKLDNREQAGRFTDSELCRRLMVFVESNAQRRLRKTRQWYVGKQNLREIGN